MRYLTIVHGPENAGMPPKELLDAINELGAEQTKDGSMLGFGGLRPSGDGAKVRISKGKLVVTDGPFAEAKEVIGGFAIFEYKTKAEAVEQARKFMDLHIKHWPGWEGVCEVRAMEVFSTQAGGPKAL